MLEARLSRLCALWTSRFVKKGIRKSTVEQQRILELFWRDGSNMLNSGIHQRRRSIFDVLPIQSGAIIFLGDSLIQTCEWGELMGHSNIKNRGISGDTIRMVLERLPQALTSHPSKIILMVGINDLRHKTCELKNVLQPYKALLDKIAQDSPQTEVLVHGVLPIHLDIFQQQFRKDGTHINQNVVSFNQELQKIVQHQTNAAYIDLGPLLTQNGQIKARYTIDGLHLSGDAYIVWAKHIAPLLTDSSNFLADPLPPNNDGHS